MCVKGAKKTHLRFEFVKFDSHQIINLGIKKKKLPPKMGNNKKTIKNTTLYGKTQTPSMSEY